MTFSNVQHYFRLLRGTPEQVSFAKYVLKKENFPDTLIESLLAVGDVSNPDFERTFREFYPEAKPTEPAPDEPEASAIPDLLPCPDLPGYQVDRWGIPYAETKQGRKGGKVAIENYEYFARGEKKPRHITRYRLTVNGNRRSIFPRYLLKARLIAERTWKKGGAEVGAPENAKN